MTGLGEWLDALLGHDVSWCAKRLSANDTVANGAHQAGPYLPKDFLFAVLPEINRSDVTNPDLWIDVNVDPQVDYRRVRAIWYNSKVVEGRSNGRNETRITNFGGAASPLLDAENTGALAVFLFAPPEVAPRCRIWVCRNQAEETLVEDRLGPVEPGRSLTHVSVAWKMPVPARVARSGCKLEPDEIPPEWRLSFPTGAAIIRKVVEMRSDRDLPPDRRLLRRRDCEFEIFRSVEESLELPSIKAGFTAIDDFLASAQTVLQRRKARSGRSLELHAREILIEEGLKEGIDFVHGPESDPGKKPDFLFPSEAAYKDPGFPADRLRMLAVKTTCRDRWRQVRSEADRIEAKHLLTLQEGVSESQFREMTEARIKLVVPEPLIKAFPTSVREHLLTIGSFIDEVKRLGEVPA